ncbi:hypothetical protein MKQ70_17065 [Chitinophaga sedimenti]|uniref:hypothetical protein n=1 Tax=Chitinophaga sedimenti TaxID=2033606 RepID=UPI0020065481|nr:hypothetical protein [Chitinophaga sedimenti]MCK7556637.1 hypothetical protein [Chitinophaga sedimenti]
MDQAFTDRIFNLQEQGLNDAAIELFHYQYRENNIYRAYVDALKVQPHKVTELHRIPFLPIQFFKSHRVACGEFSPEVVFESSGTTQTINSRHEVKRADIYLRSYITCFEEFYGPVGDFVVLGLLPSYLERKSSSLVYMVQDMIARSAHPESGFYLYEHDKLRQTLESLEARGQKVLLIGVTFGLLDFAAAHQLHLKIPL